MLVNAIVVAVPMVLDTNPRPSAAKSLNPVSEKAVLPECTVAHPRNDPEPTANFPGAKSAPKGGRPEGEVGQLLGSATRAGAARGPEKAAKARDGISSRTTNTEPRASSRAAPAVRGAGRCPCRRGQAKTSRRK